jgi:hypothetical protein
VTVDKIVEVMQEIYNDLRTQRKLPNKPRGNEVTLVEAAAGSSRKSCWICGEVGHVLATCPKAKKSGGSSGGSSGHSGKVSGRGHRGDTSGRGGGGSGHGSCGGRGRGNGGDTRANSQKRGNSNDGSSDAARIHRGQHQAPTFHSQANEFALLLAAAFNDPMYSLTLNEKKRDEWMP